MADPLALEEAKAELGIESNGNGKPDGSLGSELRAKRQKLVEAKDDHHDIAIPGYRGKLIGRYKRIRLPESIAMYVAGEVGIDAYVDLIAKASHDLLVRKSADAPPVPLAESEGLGTEPIRWGDERVATVFGLDPEEIQAKGGRPSARLLIRGVLPDDNLISSHGIVLAGWLAGAEEEDDEDF